MPTLLKQERQRRKKSLLSDEVLVKATNHTITYEPFGASLDSFHDRSDELVIVGPKGTGKSLGALHKVHLVLSKYPGSKGFMSRKTRTSMTNSCLDMYQKMVLKPPDKVNFLKSDQQFNYPNKSMLAVIGMDNVDRLNSSEWDIGYMQECTEATENDWEICTACIRHGVVPYQQMIGDCNPDKPTHWMLSRIKKGLTVEYKSVHRDNPKFYNRLTGQWTIEGERYINKLARLTGVRYKRLFMGEWAAAEGIVYESFDESIHVIDRKELPHGWEEWPRYWGFDFGHTHPLVWQEWIEAPNGAIYLLREFYHTKTLVEDLCGLLIEMNQGLPLPRAIICDHDPGERIRIEQCLGMQTLPAYKAIQVGVQAVEARLKGGPQWGGRPGIYFVRDALIREDALLKDAGSPTSTIAEIDGYVWDEKVNRLVNSKKDEIPLDKDNHGMDAMRYVVAFLDSLADDPEEFEDYAVNDEFVSISLY
jgi:PBSX family phage terminase large subunit